MPDRENRAAPFPNPSFPDQRRSAISRGLPDRLSRGLSRRLSPGGESPSLAHSPSCVTAPDCARLRAMLAAEGHNANRIVRRALAQKLWHATVCAPDAVPADLVTMHSRVVYRRHIGEPLEEGRLCFSDENAPAGSVLPILTPLGTAMLGLRAGSSAPYEIAGGIRLMLVVERVAYQPEAARRRRADAPYRDWPSSRRPGGKADAPAGGVPFATGGGEVLSLAARVRTRPVTVDPGDDPGPQAA
jgi:regulator of nucleoside diphosphate kinase